MIFRSAHFTVLSLSRLAPFLNLGCLVLFLDLELLVSAVGSCATCPGLRKDSSKIVSKRGVWPCGVEVSAGIGENADVPGILLIRTVPAGRGGFITGGALAGAGGCCDCCTYCEGGVC